MPRRGIIRSVNRTLLFVSAVLFGEQQFLLGVGVSTTKNDWLLAARTGC